jgi:hypothetical protein
MKYYTKKKKKKERERERGKEREGITHTCTHTHSHAHTRTHAHTRSLTCAGPQSVCEGVGREPEVSSGEYECGREWWWVRQIRGLDSKLAVYSGSRQC